MIDDRHPFILHLLVTRLRISLRLYSATCLAVHTPAHLQSCRGNMLDYNDTQLRHFSATFPFRIHSIMIGEITSEKWSSRRGVCGTFGYRSVSCNHLCAYFFRAVPCLSSSHQHMCMHPCISRYMHAQRNGMQHSGMPLHP